MRRIETYEWWAELVRRKDELSLRELAEQFDVTPGAISAAFKRTGLSRRAAPPGPRIRRRGKGDADGASAERDAEASEGVRPGSKDARILPFMELLGKVPDSEVATKANVSVRTIASFRARHEVGGYKGPRKRGSDRAPRRSRIDAFAHLVGQQPDRLVAARAGVSLNAVRNWRMRHGVPASGRAASEVDEAPSAVPVSGSGAWKVVVGVQTAPQVKVVVAASLAEAARRAESSGLGAILSLEWIGEVL